MTVKASGSSPGQWVLPNSPRLCCHKMRGGCMVQRPLLDPRWKYDKPKTKINKQIEDLGFIKLSLGSPWPMFPGPVWPVLMCCPSQGVPPSTATPQHLYVICPSRNPKSRILGRKLSPIEIRRLAQGTVSPRSVATLSQVSDHSLCPLSDAITF